VKLPADKITSQLKKGLAPVYFITGDETLLVGEAMDAIRAAARAQGFSERETYVADARFDWDGLRGGLDNMSLFAERKIIEVQLATGTPGREGSKAIIEYLGNPPADTLLLISAPKLDQRSSSTKWAKALEQQAVWVTVYSVQPDRLPGWLGQRMRQAGLEFEQAAVDILAARIEGNLLAAQQEISKLALLVPGQTVTADIVLKSVADGARFDIFQLADAAISQDVGRAVRVFYGLKREGTPAALVLWALIREVNTLLSLWTRIDQGETPGRAMQGLRVWQSRQTMFNRALRSHDARSIRQLATRSGVTDRVVKGVHHGKPWGALLELLLLIASPQQQMLVGFDQ
jgi:DNA polymerase-3 subunit delta